MRTLAIVAVLLGLTCHAAWADMESLHRFLQDVEKAMQVPAPLRADGQFEVVSPDASRHDQVVMFLRPPIDTYLELQQEGIKAIVLSKGDAYYLKKGANKAEPFAADARFADSDFTRADLDPFRLADYKDARISDESGGEMTVTLFPKATSPYSLVVITFDRDKKVPLKTLYYKETLNNLVKIRRDQGHVLVGRKWLPTRITMETFKLRTHTSFTLRWTQNASFPPELFDPAFLSHPSGVHWPAPETTPKP